MTLMEKFVRRTNRKFKGREIEDEEIMMLLSPISALILYLYLSCLQSNLFGMLSWDGHILFKQKKKTERLIAFLANTLIH